MTIAPSERIIPPMNALSSSRAEVAAPAPPLRVLFIDHTAKMSGGEIALLNLLTALDRRTIDPIVLLFSDGPLAEKLRAIHIDVHVMGLSSEVLDTRKDAVGAGLLFKLGTVLKSAAFAWKVSRTIRKIRPVVVHTNSLKSDILGGLAARLARVPLIWHVRDRISDDYLPAKVVRVFRWLARWLPTKVVTISKSTRLALDGDGKRKVNAHIVYDGTPIDPNDPVESTTSDAPLIGLVGRISSWKGQHIFVEAAAAVLKRFPAARFRIIGSALFAEKAYEDKVRALVDSLSIAHAIEFRGFCEDVMSEIRQLDILAHASTIGEPFGQVIIEGMAAGKAVVATDGGGVPEIVVSGDTGLLVPMGDSNAMAEALAMLLDDAPRRFQMGRRGRMRVLEEFSIARTAREMEQVFLQLARSR